MLCEVDKEVVLIRPIGDSNPFGNGVRTSNMDVDGAGLQMQEAYKVVKKLEVQVLCTQHNPVRARQPYYSRDSTS